MDMGWGQDRAGGTNPGGGAGASAIEKGTGAEATPALVVAQRVLAIGAGKQCGSRRGCGLLVLQGTEASGSSAKSESHVVIFDYPCFYVMMT